MRRSSMTKASLRWRRPSHSEGLLWLSGRSDDRLGLLANVRAAACSAGVSAASVEASADLVEEVAGDAGGPAVGVVEGRGDAVGDGTLKGCQVG